MQPIEPRFGTHGSSGGNGTAVVGIGRLVLFAVVVATLSIAPLATAATSIQLIQVTHDNDRDAETSIAINPTNARDVVAGWISSGDRTCAYGVSFNGGRTWSTIAPLPGIQKNSGGKFDRGTDPSIAFDKDGNV